MALVKCPDCETKISDKAVNCPKCGRPGPFPVENELGRQILLIMMITCVIIFILFQCFSCVSDHYKWKEEKERVAKLTPEQRAAEIKANEEKRDSEERRKQEEIQKRENELKAREEKAKHKNQNVNENMIILCKGYVSNRLKDPDSAKWEDVFVGKSAVCGSVNSKNSFGGYSGFQSFICGGENAIFFEDDFAAGEFVKSWNKFCR